MGIELLKTSQAEARAILSQLPDAIWNDDRNRMTLSSGTVDWIELLSDSDNRIYKITLHLHRDALSLGAVIQAWGIPCGLESIRAENTFSDFTDANYYFEGDYENNTIWIPTNDFIVKPSSSVTGINLYPPTGSILYGSEVVNSCAFDRPSWTGFKNYTFSPNRFQ